MLPKNSVFTFPCDVFLFLLSSHSWGWASVSFSFHFCSNSFSLCQNVFQDLWCISRLCFRVYPYIPSFQSHLKKGRANQLLQLVFPMPCTNFLRTPLLCWTHFNQLMSVSAMKLSLIISVLSGHGVKTVSFTQMSEQIYYSFPNSLYNL